MQGEYRSSSSSEDSAGSAAAQAAAAAAAVAAKEEHGVTVAVAPPMALAPLNQQQPTRRQYRGVRMRKWGKWVAEIREPHKRTRIWLGSYATPVAAARAYDTAVFYLRGRSARLNFPDEISALALPSPAPEAGGELEADGGGALSAASIRKKAIEVGSRVDALQTGMTVVAAAGAPAHHHRERQRHSQPRDDEEEEEELQGQLHHQKQQRMAWNGRVKNPDLNQAPDPDSSDAEGSSAKKNMKKPKLLLIHNLQTSTLQLRAAYDHKQAKSDPTLAILPPAPRVGGRRLALGRWVGGEVHVGSVLDKNEGGRTPQVAVFPNVKKDSCNSDKTSHLATSFPLFFSSC